MFEELKHDLIAQVQYNCDVSDSLFWGYFSICGLLMNLRALYLTVNDMNPWDHIDQASISAWINEKERRWEELEDRDFANITVAGNSYDPFDVASINSELNEAGLIYGAGYGLFKKPSFFLAEASSVRELQDCFVYTADREYARDLFTSPGMLQAKRIFLRHKPLSMLLWDKFLESKAGNNAALERGFAFYGLADENGTGTTFISKFDRIVREYLEVVLYHELGEDAERDPGWADLLGATDTKQEEFFVRAIQDLIADTSASGPIKHCIETKNYRALSLTVALLDRYRVKMHQEMRDAFEKFVESKEWGLIERARLSIHSKLTALRAELVAVYGNGANKDALRKKIMQISSS